MQDELMKRATTYIDARRAQELDHTDRALNNARTEAHDDFMMYLDIVGIAYEDREDAARIAEAVAKGELMDNRRKTRSLKHHPLNIEVYGSEGLDAEFVKSIESLGVLTPLTILADGTIISGHRRWMAATQLNLEYVPIKVVDIQDELEIKRAVIEANRQREKTLSQKMREGDVLEEIEREKAKKRQAASNPHVQDLGPERETGQSRDAVAAAVGFGSGRQYSRAKKVWDAAKEGDKEAQELVEKLDAEEITVTRAYKIVRRKEVHEEKKDSPPLPDDKYRVWYADPPWKYNDSGVINDDNYGRAERHYPTMSKGELIEFGEEVKGKATDNAVLFLWTTSPMIEDAFEVIKAWGFKYKTSFVWDKVRHNFGHYNSVRHEFLLVCTRGSCTPDNLKLFDSVQTIEKSNKHSEKPTEFMDIIDTLYTHGKRIELFARGAREGWDTWGNEPEIQS